MSVQTQIDRLTAAKADIKAAITGKGVAVPDAAALDELGGYIAQIAEAAPAVEQATPSISVSSAGLITASATQAAGTVAAGTKSATKQLTVQAAKTVTPTTSNQTAVASGRYTTGAVTVKGDANLKAENIAEGVSIFGVTGTHKGGASVETCTMKITLALTTIAKLGYVRMNGESMETVFESPAVSSRTVQNVVCGTMVYLEFTAPSMGGTGVSGLETLTGAFGGDPSFFLFKVTAGAGETATAEF